MYYAGILSLCAGVPNLAALRTAVVYLFAKTGREAESAPPSSMRVKHFTDDDHPFVSKTKPFYPSSTQWEWIGYPNQFLANRDTKLPSPLA